MSAEIIAGEGKEMLIDSGGSPADEEAMEEGAVDASEEVERKIKRAMDFAADDGSEENKAGSRTRKKGSEAAADRSSREKKTVERYMGMSSVRASAPKAITIQQGSGTKLKDIPNVFFLMSKRRINENLQALHLVLFGRKAKAHSLKKNIYEFSGFTWPSDEDKHRTKLKEKLDKYKKDQLFDFCKLLDISVLKGGTKEYMVNKLLQFLESPHVTRDNVLSEKDEKRKRKVGKRSREAKSSKEKLKKQKKGPGATRRRKLFEEDEDDDDGSGTESAPKEEEEDYEDDETISRSEGNNDEDNNKGDDEEVKDPMANKEGSDEEAKRGAYNKVNLSSPHSNRIPLKVLENTNLDESRDGNPKSILSQGSGRRTKKADSIAKPSPLKKSKSSSKSLSSSLKNDAGKDQGVNNAATNERMAGKKQGVKQKVTKVSREMQGVDIEAERIVHEIKDTGPSREELQPVIRRMLKEMDFLKTTVADVIKKLGAHFNTDLMPRKAEIKEIMEETMMTDDEDEDEDEEEARKQGGDANGDKEDGEFGGEAFDIGNADDSEGGEPRGCLDGKGKGDGNVVREVAGGVKEEGEGAGFGGGNAEQGDARGEFDGKGDGRAGGVGGNASRVEEVEGELGWAGCSSSGNVERGNLCVGFNGAGGEEEETEREAKPAASMAGEEIAIKS